MIRIDKYVEPTTPPADKVWLYYDVADGDIKTKDDTGTVKVVTPIGSETGWDDNVQPFSAAKGNGTTEPVWANMGNGNYAMKFTTGDELFVQFHNDHRYALGTDAYPHIHFLCNEAQDAGAYVEWEFAYTIAQGHNQGQSLTGARTPLTIRYTYDGTEVAGEHIIVECSDLQAFDLIEPDVLVMAGVELVAETVSGNIYGLMCDLHYQIDRDHTPNKAPDFYN